MAGAVRLPFAPGARPEDPHSNKFQFLVSSFKFPSAFANGQRRTTNDCFSGIVRNRFRFRYEQRLHSLGFHRNHIILILQNSFDSQKRSEASSSQLR